MILHPLKTILNTVNHLIALDKVLLRMAKDFLSYLDTVFQKDETADLIGLVGRCFLQHRQRCDGRQGRLAKENVGKEARIDKRVVQYINYLLDSLRWVREHSSFDFVPQSDIVSYFFFREAARQGFEMRFLTKPTSFQLTLIGRKKWPLNPCSPSIGRLFEGLTGEILIALNDGETFLNPNRF